MIFVDTDNFPFKYVENTSFMFNGLSSLYHRGSHITETAMWPGIRPTITRNSFNSFKYSDHTDTEIRYKC